MSQLQQAGPHPFPSSLAPPPASPPLTSKLFLRDRISWTGESWTLPCSCSQAGDGSHGNHHPGHQSPFPSNTRVHGPAHAIWGNVCPLHTVRALERPRALGGKLWPLDPEGILECIQLSHVTNKKTKADGSQAAGLRRERRADSRTHTVIGGCGRDLSRGIQMGKYGGRPDWQAAPRALQYAPPASAKASVKPQPSRCLT